MKQHTNGYVGNRVLKLNVGFLLASGSGHIKDTTLDIPKIRVAEDVDLDYIKGTLRLTRIKEGILVQGKLNAGFESECYRCLDPIEREVTLQIEELFAYPVPRDSEFSVGEDGILDLAPLVRSEILIEEEHSALCQPDCRGLCPECGENLNRGACACADEAIDPRLAKLKALRDQMR
ncbi:MAG: DUF177 domain-containing protein [Anaerolineae bacterium]|nr:DUF177 domain-containing protein [Anaerolineae bacterium]